MHAVRDDSNDRSGTAGAGWSWKAAAVGLGALCMLPFVGGCEVSEPPTRIHGQAHLTLIHTSDIHSRLFPYALQIGQVDAQLGLGSTGTIATIGGAARMSHIISRERARAGRSLHIDGGDCFQGAPIFNYYSGEAELRALSQMGVDAMVIANHEFDRGPINIANMINLHASFPVLAANYQFDDWRVEGNPQLGRDIQPYSVHMVDGLKVAVIGMGNLSTLSTLYEAPNKYGIQPLNTIDVAQFYIDLLRPLVDVVVFVTHLGLEVDERMIEETSGIDVVLGGHNHIVLQPPKIVNDCSRHRDDGGNYILLPDERGQAEDRVPTKVRRHCYPRKVILDHSGAFAKYVGRLDLVVSDDAADFDQTYDPINRFEVVSHGFQLFPVTEEIPEDPRMKALMEQYEIGLDSLIDLNMLVGYAPDGSRRAADSGGDSPMGNLVATAMWLRLGIQTDFSLTNTTGLRADMVPGPVSTEQIFNIFPFDNSISKMQLSGEEVEQLFDFVARRSAGRGCKSQAQIAGARVVINCAGCTTHKFDCTSSSDCSGNPCNLATGICEAQPPCADHIYIGAKSEKCRSNAECDTKICDLKHADSAGFGYCKCRADSDCDPKGTHLGVCDTKNVNEDGLGFCWTPIDAYASYELATSNYLAGGGSGYQVLKRNTTQADTKVEQRDALIDYIRAQKPCGFNSGFATPEGLKACTTSADCVDPKLSGDYVCACPEASREGSGGQCTTEGKCGSEGRCVLKACRDDVAAHHRKTCENAVIPALVQSCESKLGACQVAGEACKYLACIDRRMGNYSDDRIMMLGR